MRLQRTFTRKTLGADDAVKLTTNAAFEFQMSLQVTFSLIFTTAVVRAEMKIRQHVQAVFDGKIDPR